MNEREKLIELLKQADDKCESIKQCENCVGFGKGAECVNFLIADHLLANGVIVPPCKVGDTYYTIQRYCNTDPFETEKEPTMPWECENYCGRSDCSFSEYRIEEHHFGTVNYILRIEKEIGKTVFLTKEEAETALAERGKQ